jgi:hypothetical protein
MTAKAGRLLHATHATAAPLADLPEATLALQPITLAEANAYIVAHHRHHGPVVGWKFGLAVNDGAQVVGVITVGRPVARNLDDGYTVEVNRCCTDGTPHAASKLYAAAWRAARALGYRRLITYTLATEPGTSLVAAGWRIVGEVKGRNWSCPSRPRVDTHPLQDKLLWECPLNHWTEYRTEEERPG